MSAPDTNISRQKRRHWGALAGMAAVVLFAGALGVIYLTNLVAEGETPQTPDVIIDGRTGEPENVAE